MLKRTIQVKCKNMLKRTIQAKCLTGDHRGIGCIRGQHRGIALGRRGIGCTSSLPSDP